MSNKLCKTGMATKCVFKRNVKPNVVCAYSQTCIYQETIDVIKHGSLLVNEAAKIKTSQEVL